MAPRPKTSVFIKTRRGEDTTTKGRGANVTMELETWRDAPRSQGCQKPPRLEEAEKDPPSLEPPEGVQPSA